MQGGPAAVLADVGLSVHCRSANGNVTSYTVTVTVQGLQARIVLLCCRSLLQSVIAAAMKAILHVYAGILRHWAA